MAHTKIVLGAALSALASAGVGAAILFEEPAYKGEAGLCLMFAAFFGALTAALRPLPGAALLGLQVVASTAYMLSALAWVNHRFLFLVLLAPERGMVRALLVELLDIHDVEVAVVSRARGRNLDERAHQHVALHQLIAQQIAGEGWILRRQLIDLLFCAEQRVDTLLFRTAEGCDPGVELALR